MYGKKVAAFHAAMELPINRQLTEDEYILRLRLIGEEYIEFCHETACMNLTKPHANFAKEAMDLVYVLVGTLVAMGYDPDAIFDRIHASNMSKVNPVTGKPTKRADGKVLKGKWYKPADIGDLVPKYTNVVKLTPCQSHDRETQLELFACDHP